MDEKIYFKVIELFSEKGPRFTIEELARALGTSKRTIYENFKDKEALLDKTIDFFFKDIIEEGEEILNDKTLSKNEKIIKSFNSKPDIESIGSVVRHINELDRYFHLLFKKTEACLDKVWDGVIEFICESEEIKELSNAKRVILKLVLNESMKKLMDYEFLVKNKISYEDGMDMLVELMINGVLKGK